MKYLLLLGSLWLTGCITMPAEMRTYESKTDNVKHTDVEPGWVPGSVIKLGLSKSSTMPADDVIIEVAVRGDTAATREGFTVNIDGKKTTVSAIDDLSDLDANGFFRKRFMVKMDLVRQMVAGKSVWVKISHTGQTYEEGEFSIDQMSSAKRGFTKFLSALEPKTERQPGSTPGAN